MMHLPTSSASINWENYLSRVADQKIPTAVTRKILPQNKVVTGGQITSILQPCSGVYWVPAMRTARVLKELSQYSSEGTEASK